MLSITDMPVKFTGLLVLFLWCTVWCLADLRRHRDAPHRISASLHVVMAVVMLLMVSPSTWRPIVEVVPPPVFIGVFALSTLWFVVQVVARDAHWIHHGAHAVMFGAMTWHLVAMSTTMAAHGQDAGVHAGHAHGASAPMVLALVGLPLMGFLLVAAARELVRAVRPTTVDVRSGALAGFAMAFGMFWMSTGLMTPLLPWMQHLTF